MSKNNRSVTRAGPTDTSAGNEDASVGRAAGNPQTAKNESAKVDLAWVRIEERQEAESGAAEKEDKQRIKTATGVMAASEDDLTEYDSAQDDLSEYDLTQDDLAKDDLTEDDSTKGQVPDKSTGSLRKEWLSFFLRAGIFLAIILIVFTQLLLLKRVEGNAMFPFLKDGDLTLCTRHPTDLQSGDIILYETADGLHYGRILVSGEASVDIDGLGSVKVNGIQESGENVLFSTNEGGNLTYPYEVPAGSYFVLNDDREISGDSRQYGAITPSQIKGRVVSFLRRRGI